MALIGTGEEIDVRIVQGRAREHHVMRVERGGGDGRGARGQEARGGGEAVEEGSVDVEEVDMVCVAATVIMVSNDRTSLSWKNSGEMRVVEGRGRR